MSTVPLSQAPLRVIARREVLASRERLYLTCGHAIERAYHGWSHRARCRECLTTLGTSSPSTPASAGRGDLTSPNAVPPIEAPDCRPASPLSAPAGTARPERVVPAGVTPFDCPACHGDGTIPINPAWPDPQGATDVLCVDCGGTGRASRRTARPDAPDLAA